MSEVPVVTERLDSWKEIASYMGRTVRTVIRWEQEGGLPVHRVPVGRRQAIFAYPREIDEWLQRGSNGNGEHRASVIAEEIQTIAVAVPANDRARPGRSWLRKSPRWLRWAMAAVGLLAVGVFSIHSLTAPRRIEFTGTAQLTSDSAPKYGLVTDGKDIYFGERGDGRVVLSEVPVEGGTIRAIPTPFVSAIPESISPDGTQLLVLDREGEEEERSLWIVPTEGGEPRRAGKISCHSAAWSPDGKRIAYATGNGIYLASDQGVSVERVLTVTGVAELLKWSLDGKRLLFELRDVDHGKTSLWRLSLGGEAGSQRALPIPVQIGLNECCQSLAMFDLAGRAFVSAGRYSDSRISFLDKSWNLSGSRFTPVEFRDQLANIFALALDRTTRTLFVLSGATGGTELLRFNPATRDFSPFLPGIAAKDVNFSRDGRWIAYVGSQGKSLWISNADGNQKRQVNFRATEMELPRWSPDGHWIAVMAKLSNRPWRIFLVPAAGGDPKEASGGTDNQGAPTWSPDGRWLIYGNVKCQEVGTCAIHKIDLSTGQVSTLPGSGGMGTARWSPDGRYVAALYPERRQVYLFDLRTERWRKLADDVNGNDLNWSADSRYVYASRPIGDKPEILRMSLNDGKVDSAVDLSAFNRLAGRVDTWFGMAPDGSIIFMRWLDQTEVYALHYQEM